MPAPAKLPKGYENNPFFIAANGISLVFELARGVAILLIVISVLSLFSGGGGSSPDSSAGQNEWDNAVQAVGNWSPAEWSLAAGAVFIVVLAVLMVAALFGGVSAYTSAQVAKGHKVALSEAFRVSFQHLWSFLWLHIIMFVKLFLWTLLLIVPGIIMAVRYSLAGVAFYDQDKNLRGNAAIRESLRLTRGAWLTTFAGSALLNFITFGVISVLSTTGSNAVLYRQFDQLGDKPKPAAHWLSWVTLIAPFVLLALLLLFLVFMVIVIGVTGAMLYR